MLYHVISIPFIALYSTHTALQLPQSPLLPCRRNISFPANSYPLKRRNFHLYGSDFKLFANVDADRKSYWVTRNTSMSNATEHRVWGHVWNRVGKCEDKWRFGTTTTKGYVWWRLLLGVAKCPRGGPLENSALAMAFISMINDLEVVGGWTLLWKIADDTNHPPRSYSSIQSVIFNKMLTTWEIGPKKIFSNWIHPSAKKGWPVSRELLLIMLLLWLTDYISKNTNLPKCFVLRIRINSKWNDHIHQPKYQKAFNCIKTIVVLSY